MNCYTVHVVCLSGHYAKSGGKRCITQFYKPNRHVVYVAISNNFRFNGVINELWHVQKVRYERKPVNQIDEI